MYYRINILYSTGQRSASLRDRNVQQNTFLAIIQHRNSGTEREIVAVFHIRPGTESMTLIIVVQFVASYVATSIIDALSALMAATLCCVRISFIGKACQHAQGTTVNFCQLTYTLTDMQLSSNFSWFIGFADIDLQVVVIAPIEVAISVCTCLSLITG